MATELTNYIEDDWDDNALTSRSNPEKGLYYNRYASGTGDLLKGVYRPRWTQLVASPTVSNGEVELESTSSDGGNQSVIGTPSELTTGTFKTTVQWSGSGENYDTFVFAFMSKNPSPSAARTDSSYYIGLWNFNDSAYRFRVIDSSGNATNLLDKVWSGDTNQHSISVTRTSYGVFEIFEDGTSKGTATNTKYNESKYTHLGLDGEGNSLVVSVDSVQTSV